MDCVRVLRERVPFDAAHEEAARDGDVDLLHLSCARLEEGCLLVSAIVAWSVALEGDLRYVFVVAHVLESAVARMPAADVVGGRKSDFA